MSVDAERATDRFRSSRQFDLAVVAAVGFIQIVGTTFAAHHQPDRGPIGWFGYVLLSVGPLALFWRRQHPVAVLWTVFGTTLAYWSFGFPRGPVFAALIVAFATALSSRHRAAAIGAVGAGFVGFPWLGVVLGNEPAPTLADIIGLAAWLAVLLAAVELIHGRAERRRVAARSRAAEVQRQASEERVRIARELHDVVAHTISVINVQAGVGLHLLDDDPEQARDALTAIKAESKDALVELRSILGVLRAADEDQAPREPSPGLDALSRLVERAALAGLTVTVDVRGTPVPVPRGIDLAAYRIVQEAITNVIRHAGTSAARVVVSYGDDALELAIEDEGTARPLGVAAHADHGESAGHGIVGMRERATALGGRLEAGPRPGRGFAVRGRLPWKTEP